MRIWNLVSNGLSESIFIFNYNVDDIMHTSTCSYKLKLKIDRLINSETFKSYLISLNSIIWMMIIFTAIDLLSYNLSIKSLA
jgi:hypothetical protein